MLSHYTVDNGTNSVVIKTSGYEKMHVTVMLVVVQQMVASLHHMWL
jgi:hypothetical protein